MPAFTFEKLPGPQRPESAPSNTDTRSSFYRLLDRFAAMRIRRAAAMVRRDVAADKARRQS